MNAKIILKKLEPVINLLRVGLIDEAANTFSKLNIVDTPAHLSLSQDFRHLIWDIYELAVLNNFSYITRDEIIENYSKLTLEKHL